MAHSADLRREVHFGDRVILCAADRPPNVHAMFAEAVASRPQAEALICGSRRMSYADLDAEVALIAGGLAAHGIGRGDRVALLMGNGIEFVALTFAIARLGAILVPLSIRDQMPGIRHALTDSGARMIVAEAAVAGIVPPSAETPDLAHRVAIGATEGFADYGSLRAHPPIHAAAAVGEEETAAILYTSGTTGRPKGAMLTGLGIIHSASSYRSAMALGPEDRTIIVVPMSHVNSRHSASSTWRRANG